MKIYYLNYAKRNHLYNYLTSLEISFLWFVCLGFFWLYFKTKLLSH